MDLRKFIAVLILGCLCSLSVAKQLGHLTNPLERFEVPKIVNGVEADWVGTRYQVSVRLRIAEMSFGAGHICGGTLVAPHAVLTAGHCIWNAFYNSYRNASEFSVVMGNLDRYQRDNNTLVLRVNRISTREGFNINTFEEDVAILFLERAVPANYSYAYPIALNKARNLTAGTVCQVSGWGRTETGIYSSKLMIADVAIFNRTECAVSYGEYLRDGMLCAGYMNGERDACGGDSGGPMVCANKLVGVVSFGVGCAEPGYPGVYAEVAAYADWINKETGLNDEPNIVAGSMNVFPSMVLITLLLLLLFSS